jgi:hypothetical protein
MTQNIKNKIFLKKYASFVNVPSLGEKMGTSLECG